MYPGDSVGLQDYEVSGLVGSLCHSHSDGLPFLVKYNFPINTAGLPAEMEFKNDSFIHSCTLPWEALNPFNPRARFMGA